MKFNIKARCYMLGITMTHLREEVAKRTGDVIHPTEWSQFLSPAFSSPKGDRVMKTADKILTEMESK